jgi:tetratricopeptide (TPR) repeat protein
LDATLERHRERFEADPGDGVAFEALEEHLFLTSDWSELVALYRRRLSAESLQGQTEERARLLFRLGQTLDERCARPDEALDCYREVVALSPAYRPGLRQLRSAYTARGDWEHVREIAAREAVLPMRPTERASFHTEIGRVELERLGDCTAACAHFEEALATDATRSDAAAGLAEALERAGRAAEAAEAWERLAAQVEGSERTRARLAAARLQRDALGDPARSIESYRLVLAEDPRCREALDALLAAAREVGPSALLAQLLAQAFELADGDAERVALAVESSRLHAIELNDAGAARAWIRRALAIAPDDPRVQLGLAAVEREAGNREGLRDALERALAANSDAMPVAEWLAAARVRPGDPPLFGLAQIRLLSERAPDDPELLDLLAQALAREGCHEERAAVLERRVALLTDPSARASALLELGELHAQELDDRRAARQAFERAREADPMLPGLVPALERLLRKDEDWPSLRRLLESARQCGATTERTSVLCSLGEVLAEHCDDVAGAAAVFEEVLASDPLELRALSGLEALASRGFDDEALVRARQREAAATADPERLARLLADLVPRLERRSAREEALAWCGRWLAARPEDREALEAHAGLLQAMGREAELCAALTRLDRLLHGRAQAANRRRLAAVHLAAGRRAEAVAAFEAALASDPRDRAALDALVPLLEATEDAPALVRVLEARAELAEPDDAPAWLERLASVQAERLGDVPAAIRTLRRRLLEGGADEAVGAWLDRLLARDERRDELIERLRERALEAAADSSLRAGLDRRRGELLEAAGRHAEAADLWAELRSRDPGDELLAREESARRASGDRPGLVRVLRERASVEPEPPRRAALEVEIGGLLEDEAPEQAEASYRAALAGAPGSPAADAASTRLEGLLERSGRLPELAARLEERLARSPGDDALRLHERLAGLYRGPVPDRGAAQRHLEAALAVDSARADLWQALAVLCEESADTAGVLAAIDGELAASPEPSREVELRTRRARLVRELHGDPEAAQRELERVAALDPTHPEAFEALARRLEADGRVEELVALLESRLAAGAAGAAADRDTALRVRIAGLRSLALDDPSGAIAALEPALDAPGALARIASPLADLYQQTGRHDRLAQLCERAAEASNAAAERGAWLARAGQARSISGDLDGARDAFRRALAERPGDRAVEAALRDLYRRGGEAAPLARLLEQELTRVAGREEVPLRAELAALYEGALSDASAAYLQLRRLLEIEPAHAAARARAIELATALGRHEDRVALLDRALVDANSPGARARLFAQRGDVLATHLGRREEAIASFREALALDPGLAETRSQLIALLEAEGRLDEVLDSLARSVEAEDAAGRAALYERAASIAAAHSTPAAALPWLERLRAVRPGDPDVALRLVAALRQEGSPQARLRALDLALEIETRPDRVGPLALERADLLERELGAPERAARALEEARARGAADPEFLVRLDRLYTVLRRPRERCEVLEERLRSGDAPAALRRDLAALHRALGDPGRAAALLREALVKLGPGVERLELLEALGAAERERGQTAAWARVAEQELAALDPGAAVFTERRRTLRRDLAHAYRGPLASRAGALRHLRALLDEEPAAATAPDRDARELELIELLRQERWPVELASRLAARLERAPADAAGWIELARLHEERLGSPGAAAQAYRRALDERPDDLEALRGLRRVAERLGDWSAVADGLERELALRPDAAPHERASLLRVLGRVSAERLQSTTRASRAYASALEAEPRDLESLRALEALFEGMEDWRGVEGLYRSELDLLGGAEPERRQALLLRIAEIARDRHGDLDAALDSYRAAAAIAPLDPWRARELAALLRERGDLSGFAEQLAVFCDAPSVDARAEDHLELASALEALGRPAEALRRAERAHARDRDDLPLLAAIARLREATGDASGAADALEALAAREGAADAVRDLLRAAALLDARDPARAQRLYELAERRDPAEPAVVAGIARIAAGRGEDATAVRAALRHVELSIGRADVPPEAKVTTALLALRVARAPEHSEARVRLCDAILAVAPDHAEALAAQGESLFALGHPEEARRVLERRLALDVEDLDRAHHLVLIGSAREASGDDDGARLCYEEALGLDASQEAAHAGLARIHEAAGRLATAAAALETWAAQTSDPATAARCLTHAAELELRLGPRHVQAERLLESAIAADSGDSAAWLLLARLVSERGDPDAVISVVDRAASRLPESDGAARSRLALARATALERRGDMAAAADAAAAALASDPASSAAALTRARLLRGLGAWREAAEALAGFVEGPGGSADERAEVLHQLGRLRAGPLEDVPGAIDAYGRAVELAPGLVTARESLADLLVHLPERQADAIVRHHELLDQNPLRVASIRALIAIARERGDLSATNDGLALLRALGAASPDERSGAPRRLTLRLSPVLTFEDPLWEALRASAQAAAPDLASALEASIAPDARSSPGQPEAAFRAAALTAEGELSAPALVPLSDAELGGVLSLVASLSLEREQVSGDGHLVNTLAESLTRRTRKRVKRLLEDFSREALDGVDFRAWRAELRTLAAVAALETTGGDLRTALRALLGEGTAAGREIPPEADLCAAVADSPATREFLRRVLRGWMRS